MERHELGSVERATPEPRPAVSLRFRSASIVVAAAERSLLFVLYF